MTIDPHTAERIIVIGHANVGSKPHAMHLRLQPDARAGWRDIVTAFLNDTVKYDSTTCAVFVQPEYREWPETHAIAALVTEHYKQARINQNTVEAIGENQGRNFVRNLKRISMGHETAGAREWLPPMRGWTAVVCGAGVSFERDRELVAQHQGPVIAVNTSAGACAQGQVSPHVVVCTESKDVSEGIARIDRQRSHFAMDLMGFPGNWPTLHPQKLPLCFMGTEPNLAPYARQLGMLPLAYGSSCTTAAVSLALACGADRVVLVGQDCAFEQVTDDMIDYDEHTLLDARMYASGTPYEETKVTIRPSTRRARVVKPTAGDTLIDVLVVSGINERPVWTTHSMLSFAHWFTTQPPDVRARIVNATSSGAYIEDIEHAPLRDVLTLTGDRYSTSVARPRGLDGIQTEMFPVRAGRLLRHLRNIAGHGLGLQHDLQLLDWARMHSILNMWTAPERLRMRRMEGLSTADKGRRVAAAVRRACREIVACANGETTI